ncbi:Protein-tyrosine-phosphatase MKP1 [Heracleum sosnowskyi]|uniref:Protein-tyrosine-phosphatase MKP1 n=1 Tax=Heracleum sosnowskyi TaxID=360622 RepID=A0AAD8J3U2_9APIA|nr:Protein-tyrosine-phosphatase MKP1 [Heracleum sosnowskyi]
MSRKGVGCYNGPLLLNRKRHLKSERFVWRNFGMLERDDAATSDGVGGAGDSGGSFSGPCPSPVPRKTYLRSLSDSRIILPPQDPDGGSDSWDPNEDNGGSGRFKVPSTLRTRGNLRARSNLPPLQPLAVSHGLSLTAPVSDDVGKLLPCTPGGRDMSDGGERSELNLSSIRGDRDKKSELLRKDRRAFDKECSKVVEHIYVGGSAVARDREILGKHGITHILNCVGFVCPEYFKADFVYHTLWLRDRSSEDITSILYDVFDYFEYVKEQQGRVFVHCCQGVSRSTSLVIAYLMWREGKSFDEAFQYVKAAREIADPNIGFACQLVQCQKRVHAFPLSPNSLLRMYRISSHSSYDPLHLVPKMLKSPTPAALDSRGAFIIHIPSAIYVWIGLKCETIMERDARGAVCQIVRYEKLKGPVVAINEGEEPSYFWDAFTSLLPLMDKSSNWVDVTESSEKIIPGERKVSSYNVEYEIFQKAIIGGFLPPSASSGTDHETDLPHQNYLLKNLSLVLNNTDVKIVKQNEEPEELLALLGSLYIKNLSQLTICVVSADARPSGFLFWPISAPSPQLGCAACNSPGQQSPVEQGPKNYLRRRNPYL